MMSNIIDQYWEADIAIIIIIIIIIIIQFIEKKLKSHTITMNWV